MTGLGADSVLRLWDQGRGGSPLDRARLLLAHARPDLEPEARSAMPVGQRDRSIMDLRDHTLGPTIAGVSACPACGEEVEVTYAGGLGRSAEAIGASPATIGHGGREITVRPPSTRDLEVVGGLPPDEAHDTLLHCLIVEIDGALADAAPEGAEAAIDAALERADPSGRIEFKYVCPSCAHTWLELFDIVSFFWAELEAWAVRLSREVHSLALAYGWAERDILAMSAARRALYLAQVGR